MFDVYTTGFQKWLHIIQLSKMILDLSRSAKGWLVTKLVRNLKGRNDYALNHRIFSMMSSDPDRLVMQIFTRLKVVLGQLEQVSQVSRRMMRGFKL